MKIRDWIVALASIFLLVASYAGVYYGYRLYRREWNAHREVVVQIAIDVDALERDVDALAQSLRSQQTTLDSLAAREFTLALPDAYLERFARLESVQGGLAVSAINLQQALIHTQTLVLCASAYEPTLTGQVTLFAQCMVTQIATRCESFFPEGDIREQCLAPAHEFAVLLPPASEANEGA